MTVIIRGDYGDLDRELDRLAGQPTRRTRRRLDAVLHQGFEMTQAAVHTETGALKESGQVESDVDRVANTWEGDITYGSPGENGPVDYAIYEKERDVGGAGGPSDAKGDHDFFAPLETLDAEYRIALMEALRP
jgi:hypothetical protein